MRVLFLIPLLVLFSGTITAQTSPAPSLDHSEHQATLPVAVDGSKNPDLIPDDLAYRHFIMAIAEHQKPSREELAHRNFAAAQILFPTRNDYALFVSAVNGVREQLEAFDQARGKLTVDSPDAREQFTAIRSQQQTLLNSVSDRLRASLSEVGKARLDAYVREYVKKRIIIYGELPQ